MTEPSKLITPPRAASNPSPKQKFLELGSNIELHRKLVDRPEFEYAIDTALLEFQRVLCEQRGDMSVAAANHLKICGAQEFIHVLRNLSELPQMAPIEKISNLRHNA